MSIERLRIPTPDEALAYKRASASSICHGLVREGGQSLELLPGALIRAFEVEAWRERPTPNGSTIANADFVEWITAPYPRGLGTTKEVVEAILTSAKDRGAADQARLLWDRAVRRPVGSNQHVEGLDNIQAQLAPTGTSKAAGLRRLDREAEAGNDEARVALDEVKAGRKSVHRAMVDCGFRRASPERPGFSALLRAYFEEDPRRVGEWGVDEGTSAEQCVADVLNEKGSAFRRVRKEAASLAGGLEDEEGPAAAQLRAFLLLIAG